MNREQLRESNAADHRAAVRRRTEPYPGAEIVVVPSGYSYKRTLRFIARRVRRDGHTAFELRGRRTYASRLVVDLERRGVRAHEVDPSAQRRDVLLSARPAAV